MIPCLARWMNQPALRNSCPETLAILRTRCVIRASAICMFMIQVVMPLYLNAQSIDRPNIVFILVDDMGYGDVPSFYSNSKTSTPTLDELASQGRRFTDAHASGPLCHMSRYGLLTGRYPFRIDVGQWPTRPLIQSGETTLASLLKNQGYHTAMVGKWHLGFQEPEHDYSQPLHGGPVDCGFDSFFGIRASTDIPPYFYIRDQQAVQVPSDQIAANNSEDWSPIQGKFWRAGGIAPDLQLGQVLPRFTEEAIGVIQSHQQSQPSDPLFLYLAYPAPHTPWLPAPAFQGKSQVGLYGDFVMNVDAEIQRVVQALKDAKIFDETLLIITSDNGPCWYETDTEQWQHDAAGPYRGMKSDLWEAGHRMPMIAHWPNHIPAGSTSTQLICFTDFLATFADLLQTDLPANAAPDSISFLSELTPTRKPSGPMRDKLVMRAGSVRSMMMIRSGKWKLIDGLGSGGFTRPNRVVPGPGDPAGQLYDLQTDPGESVNLFQQHPEIVDRLTRERNAIVDLGK